MKTNLLLLIFIALTYSGFSQERLVPFLHLSPLEKTEIPIGLVNCKIEYSRPSMRGRKVFGALVPYDTLWRTGANKNTKLTFDDPIMIGDQLIKPGSYTFFILPKPDIWTIYFYDYIDFYGVPKDIDSIDIITQLDLPVRTIDHVEETMSVDYQSIQHNSAELCLTWERSQIRMPIRIPLHDNIETRLSANKSTLSSDYASAANILYSREEDLQMSMKYIIKSIELLEGDQGFESWIEQLKSKDLGLPWRYYLQSQIYAEMKAWDKAIVAANRSNQIAKIVGSTYYPRENGKHIALWEKQ